MTSGNGKCPKCEVPVTQVRIQRVDVIETQKAEWRGITLSCPSCKVVLGVAVDPIDLKNFVVEEVVQKLRSVQ